MASLLKLYLRELPEPVVPFAKYEDFLSCAQLLAKDEEEVRSVCVCVCMRVCVAVIHLVIRSLRVYRSWENKSARYLWPTIISWSTYASRSRDKTYTTIQLCTTHTGLEKPCIIPFCSRFLDEVQSHASENKMGVQNLATVFGPNILRPKMEDPVAIMEGINIHTFTSCKYWTYCWSYESCDILRWDI